MSSSLVQHTSLASDSSGTNIVLAYGNNVTINNVSMACISCDIGQTVSTVTDTIGSTYGGAESDSGTAQRADVYLTENVASGADTVTAAFSATTGHRRLSIFEVKDQNAPGTGNFTDQVNGAAGASTTPSVTSAATTVNGELIIGHLIAEADTAVTAGTALTYTKYEDYGHTTVVAAIEMAIQATTGTAQANWTINPSQNWIAQVVTFKPGVSGFNLTASAGPKIIRALNLTSNRHASRPFENFNL